jgi:hypothetical protein
MTPPLSKPAALLPRFVLAWMLGCAASSACGDGVRFAGITVDAARRELRFGAEVNQQEGLVEYLLVHRTGKTHESVLATAVRPADLHAAALLLGWASTNRAATVPPPRLRILLHFPGAPEAIEAARTVRLRDRDQPPALPWKYGGSVEFDGKFLAEQEGSIVTLIGDDTALVQNQHAERAKDDVWTANPKTLPRPGTRVEVIFRAETTSVEKQP